MLMDTTSTSRAIPNGLIKSRRCCLRQWWSMFVTCYMYIKNSKLSRDLRAEAFSVTYVMTQYDNINASERIVSGNQIYRLIAEPRDNHFLVDGGFFWMAIHLLLQVRVHFKEYFQGVEASYKLMWSVSSLALKDIHSPEKICILLKTFKKKRNERKLVYFCKRIL